MLRKIFDIALSITEKGKTLHWMRPLVSGTDAFFYEKAIRTQGAPHVRDAVDLKRWMLLVVFALFPCILMSVWNTGLQSLIYSQKDPGLMEQYLLASYSWSAYWDFVCQDALYLGILKEGLSLFLPVLFLSYAIGGLWEVFFACVRRHEIAEGFLVTGILYPLILPPTLPYWMLALGISFGVVVGKELFGGTGMNILNPALVSRAFLFFSFPANMTGDIWVGSSARAIDQNLQQMSEIAGKSSVDAYTQATPLAIFNIDPQIKRIHIDAIAQNTVEGDLGTRAVIEQHFSDWAALRGESLEIGSLSINQLQAFVTDPLTSGGLALAPEHYEAAHRFAALQYEAAPYTNANFFFGNQLGSFGETSVLACLIGGACLLFFRIASWRSMLATLLSAFFVAFLFQWSAQSFGVDGGAWNAAKYAFPAYKHLLLGGLMFGAIFMATDPVSSPSMNLGKWVFGALIGSLAIIIRVINPAYPEGVMLAILFANVFAPLIDYYAMRFHRRAFRVL